MRAYYDAVAPEYDEWYESLGRFDGLARKHWNEELHGLERLLESLPPKRTLDVADHFYSHLEPRERESFLADVRRVAPELIVVDAKVRAERERESWQERRTRDGKSWQLFKRYVEPEQLAAELEGGGLLEGRWFVVVRSRA